ncbi:MAG: NAD+ synthase [Proteobacteria bacterium SG_bin7]|nr:MAG: NAD+ synthase [Proteobacteria bacterium SG_bin7]
MRIALAQINSTLGSFESNAEKIIKYTADAKNRRCELVVFPEMALFGYRTSDLLERKSVVVQQLTQIGKIQKKIPEGITLIFGAVTKNPSKRGKPYFNSAVVLSKNSKPKTFNKQLLPTYDVFDEYRHLEHGETNKNIIKIKNKKILITVCEDIWAWEMPGTRNPYPANPLTNIKGKFDLVVNISASPFSLNKEKDRLFVTRQTAKQFKAPMVYVNTVGAQDELVFDGGSFALDKAGNIISQCVRFAEDLNVADFSERAGGFRSQKLEQTETIRQALVLGIKDFANKTGLSRAHLGLSGGIDSAVVACLAVDALGPSKVTTFALPGPYSATQSFDLAKKLAKEIHVELKEIEIRSAYETIVRQLENTFDSLEFGTVHENIQSRLRGLYLMAFTNYKNSLLLSTSNKDEYAAGYTTLYGDMCGGLAPIGDLLKGQVYDLANLYNKQTEIIPREIIERVPTAELRPNQKDQDTLPPYDDLDKAVRNLVQKKLNAKTKSEKWLLQALMKSEFKRWQAPPILRVTEHAFGRGRNFPIAHKAFF